MEEYPFHPLWRETGNLVVVCRCRKTKLCWPRWLQGLVGQVLAPMGERWREKGAGKEGGWALGMSSVGGKNQEE